MPDRYEDKRAELMAQGMTYDEAQTAKVPEVETTPKPAETPAKKK